ncbi:MAG: hypothetical protein D4R84_07935 [Rhodocyclaceae bacterium]|nr:MAG: hypothetical protein D4R84_07935 [Rhodocyclaceae bacterium]
MVTQVGSTVGGRAGWSQLNNLRRPELVALDAQSFVDIAVSLTRNIPRLNQLRQTLRRHLESSPLMDGKRFTTSIENAYLEIWRKLCEASFCSHLSN